MGFIDTLLSFFGFKKQTTTQVGQVEKQSFAEGTGTPVASGNGRSSVVDGVNGILVNGKQELKPLFQLQDLDLIKWHSIYNRHISKAVSDIVSLANTEYLVEFPDGISQRLIGKMTKEIKAFERAYNNGTGFRDFVKSSFETLVYSGALPAEIVIGGNPYPNTIRKVAILNPARIRFAYDQATDDFLPYQQVKNFSFSDGKNLVELNKETFIYAAIKKLEENPYAISQFISSLEDLAFDAEMVKGFQQVIKNAGVMGFLSIFTDKPPLKQGETQDQYFNRCVDFLRANIVPDAEKGFGSGVMAGYKGSTDIEFKANNASYTGAEKAFEITNKRLYNAMKSHGLFFGETGAITETFARVILQVMMSLVGDYQYTIAGVMAKIFKKLLALKGLQVEYLTVRFESAMIGDTLKDAQADAQKLANIEKKLLLGIIDINQAAQEAGYDEPTDTPYTLPNPQGGSNLNQPVSNPTTDPSSQQALEKKKHFSHSLKTEYESVLFHGANCSCKDCKKPTIQEKRIVQSFRKENKGLQNLQLLDFASTDLGDDYLSSKADKYFESIEKIFNAFAKKVGKDIKAELKGKAEISESELVEKAIAKMFSNFESEFTENIPDKVSKYVGDAYNYYRKDKSIFPKKTTKQNQRTFDDFTPPDAILDFLDLRLIEYLKGSDEFYLGKFINDPALRKRMSEWIKDWYVANDGEIGSSETLNEFVKEFEEELKGVSKPMIRRIIDTTMTNSRSYAHIKYMNQAGVAKFRRVEVGDRLTCAHCNAINGREFEVAKEIKKADKFTNQNPEDIGDYAPFGTSIKIEDFEKLSETELQDAGIGCNALHPHCRGRNVAVI